MKRIAGFFIGVILALAKIYGLIRTALLETIQGSNDGPCMATAY